MYKIKNLDSSVRKVYDIRNGWVFLNPGQEVLLKEIPKNINEFFSVEPKNQKPTLNDKRDEEMKSNERRKSGNRNKSVKEE